MPNSIHVLYYGAMRCIVAFQLAATTFGQQPCARELGLAPGVVPVGKWNAITDAAGVAVRQATQIEGKTVRTGVTAIQPHCGNLFHDKVAGAVFVGNALGKLAGPRK